MSTDNGGKKRNKTGDARALGLRLSRDRIIISVDDERGVSVPREWYPTLEQATTAKRSRCILLGDGQGFRWDALDLDLSVAGLDNGLKEALTSPPAIAKTRRKELAAG